jgi:hypothetical protein
VRGIHPLAAPHPSARVRHARVRTPRLMLGGAGVLGYAALRSKMKSKVCVHPWNTFCEGCIHMLAIGLPFHVSVKVVLSGARTVAIRRVTRAGAWRRAQRAHGTLVFRVRVLVSISGPLQTSK